MIMLSYMLMGLNAIGGFLLLFLLKNGRRPSLVGIRWCLRILATIPLVGICLNLIQQSQLIPLAIFSPIRLCIGYTLLGTAIWGLVVWFLRQTKTPGVGDRSR